jgi:hexosaminidase
VSDKPRFEYRGFLLDTARHYYPLTVILQHLDAMAYAKLNVLHWHIVDDTSFPYQSTTFPEMSATGAFSPKHVYTHADINRVQDYAYLRGIRVIPEFDVPGHVTKGYLALKPQIVTDCYNYKYKTGPLNPTINATYEFLDKFYDELKTVWRDNYFHIGGDEVIKKCWASNPDVMAWLKAHPEVGDLDGLQNYFIVKLLDMLKQKGLSYMVWQEVFDSGAKLKPETVVEVWLPETWKKTMAKVVKGGNRVVLAAPFYLNLISYGLDWHTYYNTEPTDFPGGAAAEANGLVSGVEATMWSEYVDATNFISRSWARTAAVAERAWSAATVTDINDASRRMHQWRCKALVRNIDAEPITNGANMTSPVGFNHHCPHEWVPAYVPLE